MWAKCRARSCSPTTASPTSSWSWTATATCPTLAGWRRASPSFLSARWYAGRAYFSVVSPPAATIVLKPGDAFTATVKYAPPTSDTNASDSGTLEFDSDDLLHPQLPVALDGQSAAAPVCKIKVVPTPGATGTFFGRVLQFGNVMVGRTKTLPVTLTNTGSANCPISGWKFVLGITALGRGA